MSSRMLATLVSSWLPALGVILPVSAAYRANALVVGILATVLTAFSVVHDRARYGAAVLAAWTGVMPFLGGGTVVEVALNTFWAVAMVTWLIGPFSQSPAVTFTRPALAQIVEPEHAPVLRDAA